MKKKIISTLLMLVMASSMVISCGKNDAASNETVEETAKEAEAQAEGDGPIWTPKSVEYVPEEAGDFIAQSIDQSVKMLADNTHIKLSQRYQTLIALMYSYEQLDERAQKKVESFSELNQLYKETYFKYIEVPAAVGDIEGVWHANAEEYFETVPFSSVYNKQDYENIFEVYEDIESEKIAEGETYQTGYTITRKDPLFGDDYYEIEKKYDSTPDTYSHEGQAIIEYTVDDGLVLLGPLSINKTNQSTLVGFGLSKTAYGKAWGQDEYRGWHEDIEKADTSALLLVLGSLYMDEYKNELPGCMKLFVPDEEVLPENVAKIYPGAGVNEVLCPYVYAENINATYSDVADTAITAIKGGKNQTEVTELDMFLEEYNTAKAVELFDNHGLEFVYVDNDDGYYVVFLEKILSDDDNSEFSSSMPTDKEMEQVAKDFYQEAKNACGDDIHLRVAYVVGQLATLRNDTEGHFERTFILDEKGENWDLMTGSEIINSYNSSY